jgi:hypothetical protein
LLKGWMESWVKSSLVILSWKVNCCS